MKTSLNNTLVVTLIMLLSQMTLLRNENTDTLASNNCTKNQSIVIGVTFSLIVIMLQPKFLVRVHPVVATNILIVQKEISISECEHINILY